MPVKLVIVFDKTCGILFDLFNFVHNQVRSFKVRILIQVQYYCHYCFLYKKESTKTSSLFGAGGNMDAFAITFN